MEARQTGPSCGGKDMDFSFEILRKKKHRLGLGIVNTTIYNLGIYISMDDMDEQMHNENSWLYDHRSNLDGSRLIIP